MPQFVLGEEFLLATQLLVAFIGAYFIAFWLGLVVWTFNDIRARSRDVVAYFLAISLVLVFNLPGLLLYVLLRPRETLAERYERTLEEEAIMQELDQHKLACPSCKRPVQDDFLLCPHCRTQLKQSCLRCAKALNLSWRACPYCGTVSTRDEIASTSNGNGATAPLEVTRTT